MPKHSWSVAFLQMVNKPCNRLVIFSSVAMITYARGFRLKLWFYHSFTALVKSLIKAINICACTSWQECMLIGSSVPFHVQGVWRKPGRKLSLAGLILQLRGFQY